MRWWALVLAVGLCKVAVAAQWGLSADEAYHFVWSDRPAWGYFDQPPLIAWVLWAARHLGEGPVVLRAVSIVGWLAAVSALLPFAKDRGLWLLLGLGLPPLFVMTTLAVPDALLLSAWGLGLACALRGGRFWVLAGLFAGLAALSKHTGLALVPLLWLAALPAERKSAPPLLAMALAGALLLPHVAWMAAHDWETLRFQAAEGLWHPRAPGWAGVPLQLLDQFAIVAGLPFVAMVLWGALGLSSWDKLDRIDRMCLATSLPLFVGFALAAVGGPPEAHWTAPAWVGAALGLSRTSGRLRRFATAGGALAATVGALFVVHTMHPLVRIPKDPGTRFTEGAAFAEEVKRWVVPAAVGNEEALPVLTERYQEAALIRYHTGIDARPLPGCGRRTQYDLWPEEAPTHAWFIRPATGGPPHCALGSFAEAFGPNDLRAFDAEGRKLGPWQLFELSGSR